MKISYNWLKEYLPMTESPQEVSTFLTDIGLEVEGEEEIESIPGGLKGLKIGKVLACEKHPNADRLSVTKVDIGEPEPLDIVCGAPNVAIDQYVVVAPPKTTLYPTGGEPFTIKKGKIRGAVSEGMICAEDEIGLGQSHNGIMVLENPIAPGTPANKVFEVHTDYIFEIGLTPNRSDATCHLGVAEDLAAALQVQKKKPLVVRRPTTSWEAPAVEPLQIQVLNTVACPRYAGVCIENIKIGPSPKWLRERLESIGVRSINNMVDITNFILHEYGQPLHAFDYDKIEGEGIIVRTLPEGSKFLSLDEKERTLTDEDLMICDAKNKPMCIGGVFGGLDSGVTDATTRIFLESAHFDPSYIRRSSTRHDLRTDAAKVFEKGSDPNICVEALQRAVALVVEICEGTVFSKIYDLYPVPIAPKVIEVRYQEINRVLGVALDSEAISYILEALRMPIKSKSEQSITVEVPTNKADVLREIDVIEEILRIYGFNNIPLPGNFKYASQPQGNTYGDKNRMSDYLVSMGFLEMMGLSLTRSKYLETGIFPFEKENLVFVNNTSTQELDIMRPSTIFNTLEAVQHNQNRQQSNIRLFEFGKKYQKSGENFVETNVLTITMVGKYQSENWLSKNRNFHSFYSFKAIIENVLSLMGLSNIAFGILEDGLWGYGLHAKRGRFDLVKFGSVKQEMLSAFGIKSEVLFAEFDWDALQKLKSGKATFKALNKYPSIRRDLALLLDSTVKYDAIEAIIRKTEKKNIESINLFDVFEDAKKLGEDKKSYALSIIFQDETKTLSDKEVDKMMNKIIYNLENNLKITIRR